MRSYLWGHAHEVTYIYFLSLLHFTEHNTFQIHPCCFKCKWQDFLFLRLNSVLSSLCVCLCVCIHKYMIFSFIKKIVIFISWLLWIKLQWGVECKESIRQSYFLWWNSQGSERSVCQEPSSTSKRKI